jgi:hypothetical protein
MKHAPICSNVTLYSIFNCLIKFINISTDLRVKVIPIFEQYFESWDPELQQRSIEYMMIAKLDGEDSGIPNMSEIRAKLFEKMPAYSQEIFNNSILNKRLQQTAIGQYTNKITNTSNSGQNSTVVDSSENASSPSKNYNNPNFEGNVEVIGKLMTSTNFEGSSNPYSDHILYQKDPNGFAVNMNKNPEFAVAINKENLQFNFDLFKSMLTNPHPNGGLIYADHNVKVDCKIKFFQGNSDSTGVVGLMFLFIPTSSEAKIEDIEFQLTNYHTSELLNVQISKVKYPDSNSSVPYPQVLMKAQINDSFSVPPTVNLNCLLGMKKLSINFALPLMVTKYLEPYETPVENFTAMWYEFTNSPEDIFQKMDAILYNPMANNFNIMDFLKKFGGLMTNLQFKVFPPLDRENFHELEGIAVLNYHDKNHSIPILFQASFIPSHSLEFRLSLRSKNVEFEKFSTLLLDIFSVIKFYINP